MTTKTLNALLLTGLLGLTGSAIASDATNPNALEPCINGQVSASGLYASQADEDAARKAQRLEPAVNGEVSTSGLYPTQAVEDAVLTAGENALEPAINGAVSDDGLYPSQGMKRQALGS
jgi:hypothetical protein